VVRVTTTEGAMKRVDVREFRDHATKYLAGNEPPAIERYGDTIGFYIPTGIGQRDPAAEAERRTRITESFARLEKTIQKILDETGMTEDGLADLLDPTKPLPGHPIRRPRPATVSNHASGV
jgi:hypothetical protein